MEDGGTALGRGDAPPSRAGLLVDLDGTLADSVPALRAALTAFLAERGRDERPGTFDALNGVPLPEVVARLARDYELSEDAGELAADFLARVRAAHATAVPRAGARELLDVARELGRPVAVVTSSPRAAATVWLAGVGLLARVAAVVGAEDGARGKPFPDPYVEALARLGCDTAASLAVEDSALGARSARAAGLRTWVLGEPERGGPWPPGVRFAAGLAPVADELRASGRRGPG